MPYLKITTNATVSDQSNLLKISSQTVSKAAGKAENYVMIAVEDQANMFMAGDNSPTAFLDYRALGLPSDRSAFSDALCSLITNELGISGDRIYISMTDSERQNWGWNHATF